MASYWDTVRIELNNAWNKLWYEVENLENNWNHSLREVLRELDTAHALLGVAVVFFFLVLYLRSARS